MGINLKAKIIVFYSYVAFLLYVGMLYHVDANEDYCKDGIKIDLEKEVQIENELLKELRDELL